jgi:hypothetical protein
VLHQGSTEYKEIQLEEASCFSLEEHYEIGKNQRRVLKLGIIAGKVTIDGIEYERN